MTKYRKRPIVIEARGPITDPYPPCSWVWGDMVSAHRVRAWLDKGGKYHNG